MGKGSDRRVQGVGGVGGEVGVAVSRAIRKEGWWEWGGGGGRAGREGVPRERGGEEEDRLR